MEEGGGNTRVRFSSRVTQENVGTKMNDGFDVNFTGFVYFDVFTIIKRPRNFLASNF